MLGPRASRLFLVPDLRHDHPVLHRLARRDFLQRNGKLAIGYSRLFLEHIPERLNQLGFLFRRMARPDYADDRTDRRAFGGDIGMTSRIGRKNRMDEVRRHVHCLGMDPHKLGRDRVSLLGRKRAIRRRDRISGMLLDSLSYVTRLLTRQSASVIFGRASGPAAIAPSATGQMFSLIISIRSWVCPPSTARAE